MNKSSGELDAGEKCPGDVAKKKKTHRRRLSINSLLLMSSPTGDHWLRQTRGTTLEWNTRKRRTWNSPPCPLQPAVIRISHVRSPGTAHLFPPLPQVSQGSQPVCGFPHPASQTLA